jgi:hypothetical protein
MGMLYFSSDPSPLGDGLAAVEVALMNAQERDHLAKKTPVSDNEHGAGGQ